MCRRYSSRFMVLSSVAPSPGPLVSVMSLVLCLFDVRYARAFLGSPARGGRCAGGISTHRAVVRFCSRSADRCPGRRGVAVAAAPPPPEPGAAGEEHRRVARRGRLDAAPHEEKSRQAGSAGPPGVFSRGARTGGAVREQLPEGLSPAACALCLRRINVPCTAPFRASVEQTAEQAACHRHRTGGERLIVDAPDPGGAHGTKHSRPIGEGG